MRIKHLALSTLALSALAFSGCYTDSGTTQMGKEESNLLGVYKFQGDDYSPAGPNTFAVSTDEIYTRNNYSGDKVTLLWGLVTLKDY
ncbi:MAG: hypothetical protein ACOCVJ_03070 [Verrucomicrobiota bacterium]